MAHSVKCTYCEKPHPCPGWDVVSTGLETLVSIISRANVKLPDPDRARRLVYELCVEEDADHLGVFIFCNPRCSAAWEREPSGIVVPGASRN